MSKTLLTILHIAPSRFYKYIPSSPKGEGIEKWEIKKDKIILFENILMQKICLYLFL